MMICFVQIDYDGYLALWRAYLHHYIAFRLVLVKLSVQVSV